MSFAFGPERRIKRRADFLRVQAVGQRAMCPHFVLLVAARAAPVAPRPSAGRVASSVSVTAGMSGAPSAPGVPSTSEVPGASGLPVGAEGPGCARLGIVVTKKVGNSPERSRVKRLCREAFRLWPDLVPDGIDLVVIARDGAAGLGLAQVQGEWERARPTLLKRCRAVLESPRTSTETPR